MAIVRIDYPATQAAGFPAALASVVNTGMQEILGIPPAENYIVCQGHAPGAVLHAPGDCPAERLAGIVFIQITLNQGRPPALKAEFFRQLTQRLASTGLVQPENVFINLAEVARENWSFGIARA